MKKNNTLDPQYLNLLSEILNTGEDSDDRTGVGTKSLFGKQLRINLKEGFPIITSRSHSFKIAFHETMMFLNGATDSKKWLEDNGINIWKGNTSREFLDSRGLYDLPEGDIGKGYGYQWRNFNDQNVDQLWNAFNTLKTNPNCRRNVVSAWNPVQMDEIALPPCHILYQFYVRNNTLSCQFYMRSLDVYHGCGYDIMCYALITNFFAKALDMEVGELILTVGDTHIYNNQLEVVKEQLKMEYFELPELKIKKDINTIDDICNLKWKEDVELIGYKNAGRLKKVEMAV